MHLVEQHRIDRHDPRWHAIDKATFASKHLYNAALYVKRQAYIHEGNRIISYSDLDKLMQPTAEYRALPAKVAQWVLKQMCTAWDSYFAACAEWQRNPGARHSRFSPFPTKIPLTHDLRKRPHSR